MEMIRIVGVAAPENSSLLKILFKDVRFYQAWLSFFLLGALLNIVPKNF